MKITTRQQVKIYNIWYLIQDYQLSKEARKYNKTLTPDNRDVIIGGQGQLLLFYMFRNVEGRLNMLMKYI